MPAQYADISLIICRLLVAGYIVYSAKLSTFCHTGVACIRPTAWFLVRVVDISPILAAIFIAPVCTKVGEGFEGSLA